MVVPQLHDPVMLAKALATGDMLSGGRLTVGIGVGGRHEDYRAAGADPKTQTMREMAERVAIMKRVWAGERVGEVGKTGTAQTDRGRLHIEIHVNGHPIDPQPELARWDRQS